jgi:hypothetical protein
MVERAIASQRAGLQGRAANVVAVRRAFRPARTAFCRSTADRSPPYQRSYAWTATEAGRLLDDITTAMEAEGEGAETADYFLGTMLFIDSDRAACCVTAGR